jgi:hypothetical protein
MTPDQKYKLIEQAIIGSLTILGMVVGAGIVAWFVRK